MKLVYEADDGEQFANENECRAHEIALNFHHACGLSMEQIADVLHGNHEERANAIIGIAREIERRRAPCGALSIAAE